MDKRTWEEIRVRDTIPGPVFYEYYLEYLEDKALVTDYGEFERIFKDLIASGRIINCSFGTVKLTEQSVVIRMKQYYDNKLL